ncbi:MAG: radical SAM protein [Candidatus Diapherotrites archaeon]|nr:radical SAM protein [Candidatus Diapherotrites archaeon]
MPETKTALLLGYKCNNNCRFCYAADKRELYAMSTEEAKKHLKAAVERGSSFVDFLGGEPTIRKDLIELISHAKDLGFKTISITTNGRMLSNIEYAKKLYNAGLNSAVFSVHGHNAELHDYLVNVKGAFDQLVKGMQNFRALSDDVYICTNTVIVKPNVSFLPDIAELNAKLLANGMEFIFPHPRGNAYKNFEEMVPRLEQLIGVVQRTIGVCTSQGIKHCYFRYVPFCYMYGAINFISEYAAKESLKENHIGPEFEDLDVEKNRAKYGRIKGPQCFGCKYNNVCEGIFREYAEKRGFEELVPVP